MFLHGFFRSLSRPRWIPALRLWRQTLPWILVFAPFLLAIFSSWLTELSLRSESLPRPQYEATTGWADESVCVDCHDQGQLFWETGHARTLHRANDDSIRPRLEALKNSEAIRRHGTMLSEHKSGVLVMNRRQGFPSEALLTWCFGSGAHAHTWVASLPDSYGMTNLLEFRWSWYHETGDVAITPGQPAEPVPGYYEELGGLFDHAKTRRCFGCHSTVLPVDAGAIEETHLHAGVTCQRCHGPRAGHVASGGKLPEGNVWAGLSRDESVARCAECHRRVDEQVPSSIRTDNPEIARFQPVGLAQSLCFQRSEMTCLTCHDPHKPMQAQDSAGIWQCRQCHDGTRSDRPLCSPGHESDCLTCHMPKVATERPLHFTDHWIRIREGALPP